LLRESRSWRYSRRKILRPDEFSGLRPGVHQHAVQLAAPPGFCLTFEGGEYHA
jgi:hypothetical protein